MPEQHFENDQGPPRRLLCQTSCCAFFDCLHSGVVHLVFCYHSSSPQRNVVDTEGKKDEKKKKKVVEEEEKKERAYFPQSKRGKKQQSQQGHSNNYTLPTARRTRTHTQPKRTSPKEVKKKGKKFTAGTKRLCTTFSKFNPMEINKTTEEKKITVKQRDGEIFCFWKKNQNNHNNNFNINTKRGNKITITIRYKCKVLATGMSKTKQEGCSSISYFLWQEVSLAALPSPLSYGFHWLLPLLPTHTLRGCV